MTQARLKEVLTYCPDGGEFVWLVATSNRVKAGAIAGSVDSHGRRKITVDGLRNEAHRLAFLYMVGDWPPEEVDHINGDPLDNRWVNLRAVDRVTNQENLRRPRADNKTGYLGVVPSGKRFSAQIQARGKTKCLGTYATPQEAHAAYLAAKRELHAGCTI